MENKLAHHLKNYYFKKANKIIFKNRATLNLLAWEMNEKLSFHGIDPSTLSRVINGKRLFTPKQLEVFCNILNLKNEERFLLETALQQDILKRCGLTSKPQSCDLKYSKINSSILEYIANHIYKLRTKGLLFDAIETASFIEKVSATYKKNYPFEWKKNRRFFAQAYNERGRAWGEIATPKEVLPLIIPDTEKAILIGEELGDQAILSMAYMNVGGAQYIAKNWLFSANYLENTFKKANAGTQIEFLRTLALDYAFLGEREQFQRVRKEAIKRIERKKFSNIFNVISLLEALGRGLALLNYSKEAFSTFDEAEKMCLKAEKKYGDVPFFESQIIRGKIFSLQYSPKIDKDRFVVVAKRGLGPRFKIYKRHQQQILHSLKKLNLLHKCL